MSTTGAEMSTSGAEMSTIGNASDVGRVANASDGGVANWPTGLLVLT